MRTALAAFTLTLLALALPGTAQAQPKKRDPISIVFVIDRSGSMMGAKIDTAKAGVAEAIKLLAETDKIAVVTFDSAASVVVALEDAKPSAARDKRIADIKPGGGTNALPGLETAWNQLAGTPTKRKHVVVLADGEFPSDGIEDLIKRMAADNVTISTIALVGADEAMLKLIAVRGSGRFHKVDVPASTTKVIAAEVQTVTTGK